MAFYVTIRHQISDFDKWKTVFDEDLAHRKQNGITDLYLFRDLENPLDITTVFSVEDIAKAKEFASNPDLMHSMQKAGVINLPTMQFFSGE